MKKFNYTLLILLFALCNPFVIYGLLTHQVSFYYTFTTIETNVKAIYLPTYLPSALLIFGIICLLNFVLYSFMKNLISESINLNDFLTCQLLSQVPYLPYAYLQWVFLQGMEGNVFAFFFALPSWVWFFFSFPMSLLIFLWATLASRKH